MSPTDDDLDLPLIQRRSVAVPGGKLGREMGVFLHAAGRGWLPEWAIRAGVRRRLRGRIRRIERETEEERRELVATLVGEMDRSPPTDGAGRSAFVLSGAPAGPLRLVLGRRLKADCCFWPAGTPDLDAAEAAMLARTCENARLEDGMEILELGCGWGSLALWMAEAYRSSRILAVADAPEQRDLLERRAGKRGLGNLEVVTVVPSDSELRTGFDRVLSIETLERTPNYRELLKRIEGWLRPQGRLLVQAACHRRWPYPLETGGDVPAGLMPSDDLLYQFQEDLEIEHHWSFSGEHYQRTAEAWLRNLTHRRGEILAALGEASVLGAVSARYHLWRLRLIECAERFGYHRGQEWWVNHYLLRPRAGG